MKKVRTFSEASDNLEQGYKGGEDRHKHGKMEELKCGYWERRKKDINGNSQAVFSQLDK